MVRMLKVRVGGIGMFGNEVEEVRSCSLFVFGGVLIFIILSIVL